MSSRGNFPIEFVMRVTGDTEIAAKFQQAAAALKQLDAAVKSSTAGMSQAAAGQQRLGTAAGVTGSQLSILATRFGALNTSVAASGTAATTAATGVTRLNQVYTAQGSLINTAVVGQTRYQGALTTVGTALSGLTARQTAQNSALALSTSATTTAISGYTRLGGAITTSTAAFTAGASGVQRYASTLTSMGTSANTAVSGMTRLAGTQQQVASSTDATISKVGRLNDTYLAIGSRVTAYSFALVGLTASLQEAQGMEEFTALAAQKVAKLREKQSQAVQQYGKDSFQAAQASASLEKAESALARQQRITALSFQDAAFWISSLAVQAIPDAVKGFIKFKDAAAAAGGVGALLQAKFSALPATFAALGAALSRFVGFSKQATTSTTQLTGALTGMNAAATTAGIGVSGLGSSLLGLAGTIGILTAIETNAGGIADKMGEIHKEANKNLPALKPLFDHIGNSITSNTDAVGGVLDALGLYDQKAKDEVKRKSQQITITDGLTGATRELSVGQLESAKAAGLSIHEMVLLGPRLDGVTDSIIKQSESQQRLADNAVGTLRSIGLFEQTQGKSNQTLIDAAKAYDIAGQGVKGQTAALGVLQGNLKIVDGKLVQNTGSTGRLTGAQARLAAQSSILNKAQKEIVFSQIEAGRAVLTGYLPALEKQMNLQPQVVKDTTRTALANQALGEAYNALIGPSTERQSLLLNEQAALATLTPEIVGTVVAMNNQSIALALQNSALNNTAKAQILYSNTLADTAIGMIEGTDAANAQAAANNALAGTSIHINSVFAEMNKAISEGNLEIKALKQQTQTYIGKQNLMTLGTQAGTKAVLEWEASIITSTAESIAFRKGIEKAASAFPEITDASLLTTESLQHVTEVFKGMPEATQQAFDDMVSAFDSFAGSLKLDEDDLRTSVKDAFDDMPKWLKEALPRETKLDIVIRADMKKNAKLMVDELGAAIFAEMDADPNFRNVVKVGENLVDSIKEGVSGKALEVWQPVIDALESMPEPGAAPGVWLKWFANFQATVSDATNPTAALNKMLAQTGPSADMATAGVKGTVGAINPMNAAMQLAATTIQQFKDFAVQAFAVEIPAAINAMSATQTNPFTNLITLSFTAFEQLKKHVIQVFTVDIPSALTTAATTVNPFMGLITVALASFQQLNIAILTSWTTLMTTLNTSGLQWGALIGASFAIGFATAIGIMNTTLLTTWVMVMTTLNTSAIQWGSLIGLAFGTAFNMTLAAQFLLLMTTWTIQMTTLNTSAIMWGSLIGLSFGTAFNLALAAQFLILMTTWVLNMTTLNTSAVMWGALIGLTFGTAFNLSITTQMLIFLTTWTVHMTTLVTSALQYGLLAATNFGTGFIAIIAAVAVTLAAVHAMFIALATAAASYGTTAGTNFGTGFQSAVMPPVSSAVASIISMLTGLANTAATLGQRAGDAIGAGFQSAVPKVSSAISSMISSLNSLSSAASSAASSVSSAMSQIASSANSATSAVNSLKSAISSIKGKTVKVNVVTTRTTRVKTVKAQHGFEGLVGGPLGPTRFLAGERGLEYVSVTPINASERQEGPTIRAGAQKETVHHKLGKRMGGGPIIRVIVPFALDKREFGEAIKDVVLDNVSAY